MNFVPERGKHYDAVEFTHYLRTTKAGRPKDKANVLSFISPQYQFVLCTDKDTAEQYVAIAVNGYRDNGTYGSKFLYPTREATKEDLAKIFEEVPLADGTTKTVAKVRPANIFGSVTYIDKDGKEKEDPEKWGLKWGAVILADEEGNPQVGTPLVLSGDRREYVADKPHTEKVDAEA